MKRMLLLLQALLVSSVSIAEIGISDVKVFSGYPWPEVVIGYTVSGEDSSACTLLVSAYDHASGKDYTCLTLEGVDMSPGRHVIKWNAAADGVSNCKFHAKFSGIV